MRCVECGKVSEDPVDGHTWIDIETRWVCGDCELKAWDGVDRREEEREVARRWQDIKFIQRLI